MSARQLTVKQFLAGKGTGETTPTPRQGDGSSLGCCPLCSRSVAKWFLQSHVEECLLSDNKQNATSQPSETKPDRPPADAPVRKSGAEEAGASQTTKSVQWKGPRADATPPHHASAELHRRPSSSSAPRSAASASCTKPRQAPLQSIPSFVPCPACGATVPHTAINRHLDLECSSQQQQQTPASGHKRRRDISGNSLSAATPRDIITATKQPRAEGISGSANLREAAASRAQPIDEGGSGRPQQRPSGWEFLMDKQPKPEFGVHTGLRGGWRPTRASGVDLLAEMDNAAEAEDKEGRGAAELPDEEGAAEEELGLKSSRVQEGALGGRQWTLQMGRVARSLRLGAVLSQSCNLPGHFVIEGFITEEEEAAVVSFLDADTRNAWRPTRFNGNTIDKRYGVETDLRKRTTGPARLEIPGVLHPIMERMRKIGLPVLRDFRPNECNAIDYRRELGHELTPHVDDRQLSGDIICNLSLCGDCLMTYTKEKGIHNVDVRLPRMSLQVQAGGVRYEYQHSIANRNLLGDRRVSITFRECPIQETPRFSGASYVRMDKRFKWGGSCEEQRGAVWSRELQDGLFRCSPDGYEYCR